MANINLRNKGKDYRSRTLHAEDVVRKFRLSRPEFFRSRMASLSKRHNFALADQPPISPVDITPPSIPANLTFDYVSGNIEADSDNSIDPVNPATSGIKGYRWYLDGVFQAEEAISEYTYPNIPAGENYTLGVSAIDNAGNESALQTGVIDLTIPEAPNLSTTVTETSIIATVDPVAEAYFYNWYLDDVLITTTDTNNPGAESYEFTGLNLDQEYKVSAQVVKQYGILGERATVFATPVDVTPPNDITNLTLDNSQNLTLEASWTASTSSDLDFYEVYLDGVLDGTTAGTTYALSPLTKDQQYSVTIVSVDQSGNKSAGVTASEFARDRVAPAVPTGLTLVEALNREVDISWDANTDPDIASYKVYVNSVQNQIVNHPTTISTITGLTDGIQYSIQISAVDDVGNESALSTAILATPQDTIAPQPVTNLATSATGAEIIMTWIDSTSTDVDYVSVLLDGVEQAQILPGAQTYTFVGLTELTQYTVSAIVYDGAGNTSTEVSDTITTTSNIPDAPANFDVIEEEDYALTFDGTNDYVEVPYTADHNSSVFTIEARFRIDGGEGTYRAIASSRDLSPNRGWIIYATPANTLEFWVGDGGTSFPVLSAGAAYTLGEIHDIAVVFNAGSREIYIDGVSVATDSGVTYSPNTAQPVRIGAGQNEGSANFFLNGAVYDVKIWNDVRTATEISNNIGLNLQGNEQGLVSYWRFNEGSGTTVIDSADNHDGTIFGATYEPYFSNTVATWDPVVNVDGYNLYLKGRPTEYNTVYNGVDQYIDIGAESYGTLMDTVTIEFEIENTIDSKVMSLTGSVNNSFSMILAVYLNRDQTQSLAPNKIFFQIRDNNANQLVVATTNAHPEVSDGQKHRISVSNDANNNTVIYIDGVSVPITKSRNESLTNFIGFDYPLILGASNGRGTIANFYEGSLSDARFWSVVRTPTQINDTLNTKLEGTETGLYAYYPMNEGSGNETIDLVGTNNGVLVGNVADNMWAVNPESKTTQFVKQNTALITPLKYYLNGLVLGEYEAYATSVRDTDESDPSIIDVFNIYPEGYETISTPQELQAINDDLAAGNTTKKYYITQDLDFTGFGNFTPLGKSDADVNIAAFAGELHGGGHVISNLSTDAQAMSSSGSYGLFRGLANGAYLKRFGMENCYCRGISASYNSMVTGLPGGADILVEDVYIEGGSVDSGGDRAGGMIGYTSNFSAMYRRCYTATPIVGSGFRRGGFCAWNAGMSSENSYRDSDNDGGSGAPASGGDGGVTPKTESQMKQQATFVNWDFNNVWTIDEGVSRPKLRKGTF